MNVTSAVRSFVLASLFVVLPALVSATTQKDASEPSIVDLSVSALSAPVLPQFTIAEGAESPLLAQATEEDQPVDVYGYKRKSPTRAFLQSFLIPGWGQIYAKSSIWKPVFFIGLEAAGWAGYVNYHGNGNDMEAEYQAFADAHWDDSSYVFGLYETYYRNSSITIPRYHVDSIRDPWNEKGLWIDTVSYHLEPVPPDTLGRLQGHSHHAWYKGDGSSVDRDEFYENIGKYNQFNSGWDDYLDAIHPEDTTNNTYPGDPNDPLVGVVSPHRSTYLKMRDDANSEFNKANTILVLTVANHLISGFWAALDARAYNRSKDQFGQVEPRIRLVKSPSNPRKLMPYVTLGYRF